MNKLKKYLLSVFLFLGICTFAQPAVVVHKFDSLYQVCFYSGNSQVHCAERYFVEIDSMLKVVYNMVRVRCDTNGRVKLKKEQDDWIIEKENYFASLSTPSANQEAGDETERVIILSNETSYVRKRVIELINRLTY